MLFVANWVFSLGEIYLFFLVKGSSSVKFMGLHILPFWGLSIDFIMFRSENYEGESKIDNIFSVVEAILFSSTAFYRYCNVCFHNLTDVPRATGCNTSPNQDWSTPVLNSRTRFLFMKLFIRFSTNTSFFKHTLQSGVNKLSLTFISPQDLFPRCPRLV